MLKTLTECYTLHREEHSSADKFPFLVKDASGAYLTIAGEGGHSTGHYWLDENLDHVEEVDHRKDKEAPSYEYVGPTKISYDRSLAQCQLENQRLNGDAFPFTIIGRQGASYTIVRCVIEQGRKQYVMSNGERWAADTGARCWMLKKNSEWKTLNECYLESGRVCPFTIVHKNEEAKVEEVRIIVGANNNGWMDKAGFLWADATDRSFKLLKKEERKLLSKALPSINIPCCATHAVEVFRVCAKDSSFSLNVKVDKDECEVCYYLKLSYGTLSNLKKRIPK